MTRIRRRDIEIVTAYYAGERQTELARRYGISQAQVSRIINSPAAMELANDLEAASMADALRVLRANATRAAQRLAQGLDSRKDTVAIAAARQLLDRAGILKAATVSPIEAVTIIDDIPAEGEEP